MDELIKPPAANVDPDAVEVLRAWVADKGLHVVLNSDFYRNRPFEEEWAWGVLLADVMRHLATAIGDTRGESVDDVLEGIRDGFELEMAKPTSELKGQFTKAGGATTSPDHDCD